uniref:DNA-directed RNA polymerase subunit n=1 Tax=Pseudobryopsis hainanensis TaxID=2320808 RepID=A0A3S7SXC2_9CHLO|nr:RNA polymerase b-subunit [Pseudobryopsis hainanensis]
MFGPVNDYQCACGKKPGKTSQLVCPECGVAFVASRCRRYKLGCIILASPVVHVWYLRGRPSYLATLLNLSKKKCEALTYCMENRGFDLFSKPNRDAPPSSEREIMERFQPRCSKPRKCYAGDPRTTKEFIKFKQAVRLINRPFSFNLSRRKLNGENSLFPGVTTSFYPSGLSYPGVHRSLTALRVFYPRRSKRIFHNFKQLTSLSVRSWSFSPNFGSHIQHLGWAALSQFVQWESAGQWLYFGQYIASTPPGLYAPSAFYIYKNTDVGGGWGDTGAQTMSGYLNELSPSSELDGNAHLLLERQVRIALLGSWRNPLNPGVHAAHLKRLKLLRCFRRSPNAPSWMLLTVLPVLPPDLRPIVKLDHEQVAIADLNKLYQKVIVRSRRLERLLVNRYFKHSDECAYSQRLLQEAVDGLIENGKGGAAPICTVTRRPLKSLSDMLKGKKGRFRQNLLGKRVDYSGRSVIVVAPMLRVQECGLPREMAIELFQPFLVRRLLLQRFCRTVLGARRLIQTRSPVVWEVLTEVLRAHPVLLNRAPTLHRLSIQAFRPKLVGGRAILLHPLVCSAFNADFDGDQMAVHVPLAFEARAESWKLAWSCNNILSLASGETVLSPSQDMVIGCYFLTAGSTPRRAPYSSIYEIGSAKIDAGVSPLEIEAGGGQRSSPHQPLWISWSSPVEFDSLRQILLEIRCTRRRNLEKIYPQLHRYFGFYRKSSRNQKILTTRGRILFNQLIQSVARLH